MKMRLWYGCHSYNITQLGLANDLPKHPFTIEDPSKIVSGMVLANLKRYVTVMPQ